MNEDNKDVSMLQDFIFYLKNAVALENHALESYAVNKNNIQLQIAEKIRRQRSKWMYKFIKESKDQIYCEIKHISGIAMALQELGNRFIEYKEKDLADECFKEMQEWEAVLIILNSDKDL